MGYYNYMTDVYYKRKFDTCSFNECVARCDSEFQRSKNGRYYAKYTYQFICNQFFVENDSHFPRRRILLKIKFMNKKSLLDFFHVFGRFYDQKLQTVEQNNIDAKTPEDLINITDEDIIEFVNKTADCLNYSNQKRKNLFNSMAEFI